MCYELGAQAEKEQNQLNSVVDLDYMLAYDEYRSDRLHPFFEMRFEIPI
mgnify:CR=1 FL=1